MKFYKILGILSGCVPGTQNALKPCYILRLLRIRNQQILGKFWISMKILENVTSALLEAVETLCPHA